MIKRSKLKSLLALLLAASLCGCGKEAQQTDAGSTIALIEPVVEGVIGEKAEYRNIYNFKTYSASVYPVITEYSYAKAMQVEGYDVFFGESVKKNDTLIHASTESLDEQIENLEERIASMDESIAEQQKNLEEKLAPDKEQLGTYKWAYEAYLNGQAPAETIPSADGSEMVTNPEYTAWQKELTRWEGQYRILNHSIYMQEEAFRQSKELYELERAYLCEQLAALKASRKDNLVSAKQEGVVVGLDINKSSDRWDATLTQYGYADAEQSLIAVADLNSKILKTDYISKSDLAKVKEYYALINGKKYEVRYIPMSNEEYTKITASGEKPYTTFEFVGDASDVEIGGFAVITMFSDKKENVLSVPKSAIRKDETGHYVYVMQGSDSVYTPVKIGVSDGAYTEIVSGLSQGDMVMTEAALAYSNETVTVGYGSYNTSFKETGRMVYSQSESVVNPVQYGTTYFGEYKVENYQYVEKGDLIATIRVSPDDITIQRNKTKLQRAQERLAELIAEDNENNAKTIEAKREEIAEIEELIAEMERDGRTTEIRATRSGIITRLVEYDNEEILYHESLFVKISDSTTCYLEVVNSNQLLNYGNEVTVSYRDLDETTKTCTGTVVNVSNMAVSSDLQGDNAYIMLSQEDISNMALTNSSRENYWNQYRYQITATMREMNNILVVPRNAVVEIEGRTYVYVKDEQGNVKAVGFVAAGYNSSEYWVIEGLTEGMVLCLK